MKAIELLKRAACNGTGAQLSMSEVLEILNTLDNGHCERCDGTGWVEFLFEQDALRHGYFLLRRCGLYERFKDDLGAAQAQGGYVAILCRRET